MESCTRIPRHPFLQRLLTIHSAIRKLLLEVLPDGGRGGGAVFLPQRIQRNAGGSRPRRGAPRPRPEGDPRGVLFTPACQSGGHRAGGGRTRTRCSASWAWCWASKRCPRRTTRRTPWPSPSATPTGHRSMFNSVTGEITFKGEERLCLQTGGVEWELMVVPRSALDRLPPVGAGCPNLHLPPAPRGRHALVRVLGPGREGAVP